MPGVCRLLRMRPSTALLLPRLALCCIDHEAAYLLSLIRLYRVRIALQLKGLPYESVPVHLVRGEQKAQAYAAHVGDALVPALVTDGGALADSVHGHHRMSPDETHAETPLLPGDTEPMCGRWHRWWFARFTRSTICACSSIWYYKAGG